MNITEIIEETGEDLIVTIPWGDLVNMYAQSLEFQQRFDRIFGLDKKTENQKEATAL